MPVNQMPKSIDPQANLFECLARDAVEDALVCGFATSATDLPEVGVLQCSLDEKELFLVVEDQSASCDLVVLRALGEEVLSGDVEWAFVAGEREGWVGLRFHSVLKRD
jgi:hypothetical protein